MMTDSGAPLDDVPFVHSFTAVPSSVFIGEHTQLVAVFIGDSASIDGIGPVESGKAVDTAPLSQSMTFTLTVRRGASQVQAHLHVRASYRDRFRQLAQSPVARTHHLAAALPDGGALIMGGSSSESPHVPDSDTSQRFDPVSETMVHAPQLLFTALSPDSVLVALSSGRLLLALGGPNAFIDVGNAAARATQLFSVVDPQFVRVGDLQVDHPFGGRLTTLSDGGGLLSGTATERYDPESGQWHQVRSMPEARLGHSGTRLGDGRILFVGGFVSGLSPTSSAEIYDPDLDTFTATGALATPRVFHEATLLSDGRVLISGGGGSAADPAPVATEIYDPVSGQFSPGGDLAVARAFHTAVPLTDGRVLVVGGAQPTGPLNTAVEMTEIYDPATNRWTMGPTLHPAWMYSTVTLLANGKVLVFGGEDGQGFPVPTVMLYE